MQKRIPANKKIILVTGGARSGKSNYALELAANATHPCYVATAWDGDAEMGERIRRHRAERDPRWRTVEERTDLVGAIRDAAVVSDFILVECLTLWVSNLMFERNIDTWEALQLHVDAALEAAHDAGCPVCFVTNELGSGIVPGDATSRLFRDLAGWTNQRFAGAADTVVVTISGIPLILKG